MNKKGFTLIEILIVLVLLSMLMAIAIPGVSKIRENIKNKSELKQIELIESAAVLWGQDNKTRLQAYNCKIDNVCYKCGKVSINTLISYDYLDDDSLSESLINDKNIEIAVYKKNNRVYASYDYDACEVSVE